MLVLFRDLRPEPKNRETPSSSNKRILHGTLVQRRNKVDGPILNEQVSSLYGRRFSLRSNFVPSGLCIKVPCITFLTTLRQHPMKKRSAQHFSQILLTEALMFIAE